MIGRTPPPPPPNNQGTDTSTVQKNSKQSETTSIEQPPLTAPSNIKNVLLDQSVTVTGDDEILKTNGLGDCAAVAILSGWNDASSCYQSRTLMHLRGGSVEATQNGERGGAINLLKTLNEQLSQAGGKVIILGGSISSSEMSLVITIGQEVHGTLPIGNLTRHANVELVIGAAGGVTVYPNGHFELDGDGKEFTPKQCKEILNDVFPKAKKKTHRLT